MLNPRTRSILQVNFMLAVIAFAALTGWACNCWGGSDHSSSLTEVNSRAVQSGDGLLSRWHDFSAEGGQLNAKDLAYMQDWLANGDLMIGLLLPQAPGASQPGSLSDASEHNIFLNFEGPDGLRYFAVFLEPDPQAALLINGLYAPTAGAQWTALRPVDDSWLSELPTQPGEYSDFSGSLYYMVDFHGTDVCNHCEIQLIGCTNRQFSFGEQAALKALGVTAFTTNGELTCSDPIPTTILLSDGMGEPVPGPLALSFGLYGGTVYTTTLDGNLAVPYMLAHTAATTQTVQLGAIQSQQGWSYHWEDLDGHAISQLLVGPLQAPLWDHWDANLKLVSTGLPTCETRLDQVTLAANLVLTPTITADHQLSVQVLPDEGLCPVADVGVHHLASTAVISAGQTIDFTYTITNFESSKTDVTLTATFAPASALGTISLPAGCVRNAGTVTCTLSEVPGEGDRQLVLNVPVSTAFNGQLSSYAEVQPGGASDARFYDNASGPIYIMVSGGTGPVEYRLSLPLIVR